MLALMALACICLSPMQSPWNCLASKAGKLPAFSEPAPAPAPAAAAELPPVTQTLER